MKYRSFITTTHSDDYRTKLEAGIEDSWDKEF